MLCRVFEVISVGSMGPGRWETSDSDRRHVQMEQLELPDKVFGRQILHAHGLHISALSDLYFNLIFLPVLSPLTPFNWSLSCTQTPIYGLSLPTSEARTHCQFRPVDLDIWAGSTSSSSIYPANHPTSARARLTPMFEDCDRQDQSAFRRGCTSGPILCIRKEGLTCHLTPIYAVYYYVILQLNIYINKRRFFFGS
jgi:hypothetical protein